MINSKHLAPFICLLVFIAFISGQAWAAEEYANSDPKGNHFLLVIDGRLPAELVDILKTEIAANIDPADGLEISIMPVADQHEAAAKIIKLSDDTSVNLGGVINLIFETGKANRSILEVYHYPFAPIAAEHVISPEYSFKFGSDSALLAIKLFEEISGRTMRSATKNTTIMPAAEINPYLPREILRKTVNLTCIMKKLSDRRSVRRLAVRITDALKAFHSDEGFYVMGVLTEKALRHGQPEDTVVRIYPHLYHDKDYSKEEQEERNKEMAKHIKEVKLSESGLYYISGLDALTPYSYKYIDLSKNDDDFWYVLGRGRFLTSSVKGVVRTVPVKLESYQPLADKYQPLLKEIPAVAKYDYIIEGATVFEGPKDKARYRADVGIAGDRIMAVGDLKKADRKVSIDGSGLFLTPGFIDIHSHADWNILSTPYAPSHVRQGITTVLGGNCASSKLDIGNYYLEVDKQGAAINIGVLLGNKPVRRKVLGRRTGMFPYEELYGEKELVDLAMEEGAFGMSTGLIYSTSEEAFAWELAGMAKQMKPYGGFYASHLRGETDEVLDSVREAIYIGELAEVPVQVSHMKVLSKRNWGDMEKYLQIMKDARARGLDVTGDQYPWRASGPAAHYTLYRLMVREAIMNESPEVVLLKDMPGKYAKYSGKPLPELLAGEGITPEELLKDFKLDKDSKVYATYLCLAEEDVLRPMREDFVMVCTDASLVSFERIEANKIENNHPRKFRSYPEFFGNYVREKEVCSWELGVYKCTRLPAERMKLDDRGIIEPGAYADLVLFDPDEIDPGTDFRNQTTPPKGIKYVFINGRPALKDGEMTRIRAGKALRAYGNIKP